jgi:predicted aspartyl protease
VIRGSVDPDGVVRVYLSVAGRDWPAMIDTGFTGDLELPLACGPHVHPEFGGVVRSILADGRVIEEECYRVQFPFDGRSVSALATFAQVDEILIGNRLLREHRLEISFPRGTVLLEREA